jgi:hypothetical protein
MRWLALLLLSGLALTDITAYGQLGQLGASGDFRVNDRSGTAPTVGAPGGPSIAPDPTLFRNFAGTRSPDEILKSLDKDLSKNPLSDPGAPPSGSSLEPEKDLRPPSDRFFK